MMSFESVVFLENVIMSFYFMFLLVQDIEAIMCFERGGINENDLCPIFNKGVLCEIGHQVIVVAIYIAANEWMSVLFVSPLVLHGVNKAVTQKCLYTPSEVRQHLKDREKENLFKIKLYAAYVSYCVFHLAHLVYQRYF